MRKVDLSGSACEIVCKYVAKSTRVFNFCYAPAICNVGGGGHLASLLSVRRYIRTSRTYEKGFWAISFEYIGALDS